jgi:alkylhydroperoxidase/carboxymuconolactone decarboxylase family protein YurZ/quercetin dioxygenase-like cupin family protein
MKNEVALQKVFFDNKEPWGKPRGIEDSGNGFRCSEKRSKLRGIEPEANKRRDRIMQKVICHRHDSMKKATILMLAGIMISATDINQLNAQDMSSKKQTAGRDQLGAIAPKFAELNDDVLFGQVWSRERELPARDRSIVTIVSLIAGGNFAQLKFHLQKGKDNGLSKEELVEIITQQAFYSGWPKAWSAFAIAKEVYEDNDIAQNNAGGGGAPQMAKIKNAHLAHSTIFSLGAPVNPQWFSGKAWLQMLTINNAFNTPVANVTFAPGARNHWHSHKVGQILLVTDGEGFYQEWDKPAQKLKAGDVVNINAHIKHWHGAAADSWFAHLAINAGESEWFEPVDEKDYNNAHQK